MLIVVVNRVGRRLNQMQKCHWLIRVQAGVYLEFFLMNVVPLM